MESFRKFIGIFVIVFIALPILFGIIWAVGVTKAAVSPELLSDMPQEVIAQVPEFVDEVLVALQDEDFTTNENARQWLKAIKESEITPKELMEKIGLLSWLRDELSSSIRDLGEMLRGEIPPREIVLNMRPLKKALQNEEIDRYTMAIISKFPPCTVEQLSEWERSDFYDDDSFFSLPPCQPDPSIIAEALKEWHDEIEREIPDEVEIIDDVRHFPRHGFKTARTVISLTYLLFLIPAAFIALGALIGATSRAKFFKWCGVTTMIGGVSAFAIALFAKKAVPFALDWAPIGYSEEISIQFQEMILDKVGGLFSIIVDSFFSPVIAVAGTVAVVGLILYAFSFAMAPDEPATAPTTTRPTPPAPAPQVEAQAETEVEDEKKSEEEPPQPE